MFAVFKNPIIMIYKFLILSDEVDNFAREISIDSENTFLDLHNAILDSVNYTKNEMASFFLCDDEWEKGTEVTLMEMDTDPEFDSWVMKDTKLSELLEDEKQKMIYIFDYLTERAFFMELHEIIPGEELDQPVCSKSKGDAPKQFVEFENLEKVSTQIETGETFYGDESFELDELDEEGFDFNDGSPEASLDEHL